jgi:hypothetical protein
MTGGSFVASSGQLSGDAFGDGGPHFLKAKAAIINRGSIVSRGDTALTGGGVINSGTIRAASAEVHAENGAARDSGTIRANGDKARILVISDSGRTTITGALTTRGTGTIETSGRRVSISGKIDAGNGGSWSIDPVNLTVTAKAAKTIDASLAAGTNVTLKTTKMGASGAGTQSSGPGDIIIDSALTWNTSALLTLDAYHGIQFDAGVKVAGKGGVSLVTDDGGSGGDYAFGKGDSLTFANLASALTINGARYTLVNNIATLASDIATADNGHYALAASYNARADGTYTSSPIATELTGTFEGLGNTISNLTVDDKAQSADVGLFDTVGKAGVVRDLTLAAASISGAAYASVGSIAGLNLGTLTDDTASGLVTDGGDNANVGMLAGWVLDGSVNNSSSSGSVIGANMSNIGGLVGLLQNSRLTDASANASLSDTDDKTMTLYGAYFGGLVGLVQNSVITNAEASGSITAGSYDSNSYIGGLIGYIASGTVTDSTADAAISSVNDGTNYARTPDNIGGFAGGNAGTIDNSSSTGTFSIQDGEIGGLVSQNMGIIRNSHSTSSIDGGAIDGGLVANNLGTATISNSYATGDIDGFVSMYASDVVGGLIGSNAGNVSQSYATGNVTSSRGVAGGLIGSQYDSAVIQSYATGSVTVGADSDAGGLIGTADDSTVDQTYAAGEIVAGAGSSVGGLVGNSYGSVFTNSYWDTTTTGVKDLTQGSGTQSSEKGIKGLKNAKLKSGLPAGFGKKIWAIDPDINSGLPYLIALAKSY